MQNYNIFNADILSQGPHGNNLNTGSFTYPSSSPPLQQPFPQAWLDVSGWPQSAIDNYNHAATYQDMTSNGFFPNGQQDFVPFDEGEDFYNDEDDETMVQKAESATRVKANSGNGSDNAEKGHSTTGLDLQQPFSASKPSLAEHGKKTNTLANDRAAELRAKLIAQQRASTTPTPSASKGSATDREPKTKSATPTPVATQRAVAYPSVRSPSIHSKQVIATTGPNEKSIKQPQKVPSGESASAADIDMLIAYGKANADANKLSHVDDTNHASGGPDQGKSESSSHEEGKVPTLNDNQARRGSLGSASSSGASELGEIREVTSKPLHASGQSSRRSSPKPLSSLKGKNTLSEANSSEAVVKADKPQTASLLFDSKDNGQPFNLQNPTSQGHTKHNESKNSGQKSSGSWSTLGNNQPLQRDPNRSRPQTRAHHRFDDTGQNSSLNRDGCSNHSIKSPDYGGVAEPRTLMGSGPGSAQQKGNQRPNTRATMEFPSERSNESKAVWSEGGPPLYIANSSKLHGAAVKLSAIMTTGTANEQPTTAGTTAIDTSNSINSLDHVARIDPSIFVNEQAYQDVSDWLEMTGFYDIPHRTKRLKIHRKKRALDIERVELEREEQLELEQHSRSTRASSSFPNMNIESAPSNSIFSPEYIRSSVSKMPPPPVPAKEDMGMKIKDSASRDAQVISRSLESDLSSQHATNNLGVTGSTMKRQHPDAIDTLSDNPKDKMRRLDVGKQPQDNILLRSPTIKNQSLENRMTQNTEPRSAGYRRRSRSPERRRRSLSPIPRRSSDTAAYHGYHRALPRANLYSPSGSRNSSPSRRNNDARDLHTHRDAAYAGIDYDAKTPEERQVQYQSYTPNGVRGRGRGRTNGTMSYRGFKPYNSRGGSQGYSKGSTSLNLQGGDTRYFMIKSWTAENVEIAQRDGTWATQKKNLDTLTEAYRECRNVILCFSVNNSRAFQGYARMASAPGEAPTPVWAKDLIWESTPPFYIEWISTNETRFNRCGNLKNSLNEGQAVLVGRDGQEIEASCGIGLCRLMDGARE